MNGYHIKKKYIWGFALLCTIGVLGGLYWIMAKNSLGYILIITSLILLYGCYKANVLVAVLTTNENIIKKVFNKEEICNWEWIYAVRTVKSDITGDYITYIHWSKFKDNSQEEHGNVLIIPTSFLHNYEKLLSEIVSKKNDISIDKTTKILAGKWKV